MTTIRWKNGGPLFLQPASGSQFGLVAVDQDCCCPPPPPPRCWECLDMCAYYIEAVAPDLLATKALALDCDLPSPFYSFDSAGDEYFFKSLFPSGTTFSGGSGTSGSSSTVGQIGFVDFTGIGVPGLLGGGAVVHVASGILPDSASESCKSSAVFQNGYFSQAVVVFVLQCTPGRSPGPYSVQIRSKVSVTLGRFGEVNGNCPPGGYPPGFCLGHWAWSAFGEYDVDSSCSSKPSRQCVPVSETFHIINTPFQFTANGTDTTLGIYQSESTAGCPGDYGSLAETIGEAIRDELTATFRITSRPSCNTIPADCDVPIGEGNTTVLWGGASLDFVLGTAQAISRNDPVTGDLLFYEHQGGAGTIGDPWYFFYDRSDSTNTIVLERQYLDLYCMTDNTVSPPVTSWYVRHQTVCFEGGYTVDEWIGTIETYAAPENCGNISAGDPVPIGEPTMERSSGYPQEIVAGCVEPAPRIFFELKAPCGG